MKLWDKGYSINEQIEQFTVGKDRELDVYLAKYDVQVNKAHAKMLNKINLLTDNELSQLLEELENIANSIEKGDFIIEKEFEDVHSKIEFILTQKIGEAGKKIHTARSRNDQILTDLHLYVKEEMAILQVEVKKLFDAFIEQAAKYEHILLPGYTHLQIAMPSSFGLWFSAYGETLIDDYQMIKCAYKIADQNPLGSAAGYGSSFPIDRTFTTKELGFNDLKYNVVAAQMSRGKLEKTVGFAISSLSGTLSKFCMDACLYMSQNFGFITLPKELTTGSSIMPHKKNPDVFELLRATFNKLQAQSIESMFVTNNLPSGYHRDFQLLKEGMIAQIEQIKKALSILTFMVNSIIVNEDIVSDPKYAYMFSVESVNQMVLDGVSFRDAYRKIGQSIENDEFIFSTEINHTHEGSIGNLCLEQIKKKFG